MDERRARSTENTAVSREPESGTAGANAVSASPFEARCRSVLDGRVGAARRGHPGRGRRDRLRAARRRDPGAVVAARDQRRRLEVLPRPARHAAARDQRPAADRRASSRRSDLGRGAGLLRRRPTIGTRSATSSRTCCSSRSVCFNSPVWFNVGVEPQPQCSACFILSVDDTMDSILDWYRKEGRHLQRRLRLGREPVAHPLVEGARSPAAARRRVRCRSCGPPTRRPA